MILKKTKPQVKYQQNNNENTLIDLAGLLKHLVEKNKNIYTLHEEMLEMALHSDLSDMNNMH